MATQTTNQELQEQLDALRKDFAEVTSTLKNLTTEYAQQSDCTAGTTTGKREYC